MMATDPKPTPVQAPEPAPKQVVFKRFLVRDAKYLDDSYVSAASNQEVIGFSIHDGANTVVFEFALEERQRLAETMAGLEQMLSFVKRTANVGSGSVTARVVDVTTRAVKLIKLLTTRLK